MLRPAQRATVLRDSAEGSSHRHADTEPARIIEDMTGRALGNRLPARRACGPDPVVLSVQRLAAPGVHGFSVDLRRGAMWGLAGQAGSGRGAGLKR